VKEGQPQPRLQQANELTALRAAAASLLSNANTPEATEAAGRILGQVIEIEKQIAETEKARTERHKMEWELSTSGGRVRSEERRHIATLLAPVLTTIVLAGTLVLQTYQTLVAERDKQVDQQRQRDAAEDLRWGETLKNLSGEIKGISPGSLSFLTFFNSPRYGGLARETAQTVLLQSKDFQQFKQLFTGMYAQVNWSHWSAILELDRLITRQNLSLLQKANSGQTLTSDEDVAIRFYSNVVSYICSQLTGLLRSPRPPEFHLDMTYLSIGNCSMSGANLSGANLNGFNPTAVDFEDVDFSGAKNYETATWSKNLWWRARRIDRKMLEFLKTKFPFNPAASYGHAVSQSDYDASIQRLSQ
jgi:hypothetical protein